MASPLFESYLKSRSNDAVGLQTAHEAAPEEGEPNPFAQIMGMMGMMLLALSQGDMQRRIFARNHPSPAAKNIGMF